MPERLARLDLATAGSICAIHFDELPPLDRYPRPTAVTVVYDRAIPEATTELALAWARTADAPVHSLPVAGGEKLKDMGQWRQVLDAFAGFGMDRGALVIAAGGGTVADAVGFAAGCWLRGVPWCGMPTTLVGMADAFIGGKTAINFAGRKNAVGVFHLPRAVALLPRALLGLAAREMRNGWAEVLKTALIGDAELFRAFVAGTRGAQLPGEPSTDTISRCVRVKAGIVQLDFEDRGPRRVLNLGHTLAHALESEHGPAMGHGEAVAIGLVFAALVGADLGIGPPDLARTIARVLVEWGLPVAWDTKRASALVAHMTTDKKVRGGALHMAIPRAPGRVEVHAVPWPVVEARLTRGA